MLLMAFLPAIIGVPVKVTLLGSVVNRVLHRRQPRQVIVKEFPVQLLDDLFHAFVKLVGLRVAFNPGDPGYPYRLIIAGLVTRQRRLLMRQPVAIPFKSVEFLRAEYAFPGSERAKDRGRRILS